MRNPQNPPLPQWIPIAGAVIGFLTLIFFMVIVLLSMRDNSQITDETKGLIVFILALGASLSSTFIGGTIAAEGRIPLPGARENPIVFSAAGGIAVLIIILVVGFKLYVPLEGIEPPEATVDIERYADFSKSTCLPDGTKKDIAIFYDTYQLANFSGTTYVTRARLSNEDMKVSLFDLNSKDPEEPVDPIAPSSSDNRFPKILEWSVEVVGKEAKVKWVWENAHPGEEEGLAFVSNYKIGSISAKYKFPPGVNIREKHFGNSQINATRLATSCYTSKDECNNLNTISPVYFYWAWNMWEEC